MKDIPTREALEAFLARPEALSGGFSGAPVPTLLECDEEALMVRLSYDLPDWMVNPWHVVHGGLITALIDSAMGMVTCWVNGGVICPTVSLNTNYLRSVTPDAPLIIEVRVDRFGRVAAHLSAQCRQEGKLAVTATAVFSTASPRGTIEENQA